MLYDEHIVVYHQLSGETYCFSNVEGEVFNYCLSRKYVSYNELIKLWDDRIKDNNETEGFIALLLDSLVKCDLLSMVKNYN